jgi:hypothetical protein
LVKLSAVFVLAASALAGCHEDPAGVSTVGANNVSGTSATADTATLSWQAPTTNADGTPLTDLAGYRIYYGTNASDLTQIIQVTSIGLQTYVIDNLNAGTWYFAIKAVTREGAESSLSAIVSKTF